MMFILGNKKSNGNSECAQSPDPKQMPLPACFEGRKQCQAKSDILYEIVRQNDLLPMYERMSIHFKGYEKGARKTNQFE